MKKIIPLLIVMLLCISTFFIASVNAANNDQIVLDLSGLGIVSTDSESTNMEETVTRAEFAEMTVRLIGMEEMAKSVYRARYYDVELESFYGGCAEVLTQMNIMNGIGDGKFAPNSPVSLNEATKVLVCCLGFGDIAESDGGWPQGYIKQALSNGLLDNVRTGDTLSRKNLYRMIHNALDIKLLTVVPGTDDLERTGDTLRMALINRLGTRLYKNKGVVYATAFSYTGSPIKNLKDNEVVIDSVVYQIGTTNIAELLGYEVEFYAVDTGKGYRLLSVIPTIQNNAVIIDADKLEPKDSNKIIYFDENNYKETLTLSQTVKTIYNGIRVLYPEASLWNIENGSLKAIDNNGDKVIDVVFIDEYVNAVAKKFDGKMFTFRNDALYQGKNLLSIDPENEALKLLVQDKEGNSVDSFDTEKTVSIYKDLNSSRYRVIVSDDVISGTINMSDEESVWVDDKEYKTDKAVLSDIALGKSYTLYLDYKGHIAHAVDTQLNEYGYIVGYDSGNGFKNAEVKMLLAGIVDFGVDLNEEDVNDTSQIPFLIAQNKSVKVLTLADKVKYNGKKYKGQEIGAKLTTDELKTVQYTLNEAGEIDSLTPVEFCGGSYVKRLQYNVYEMTFGGSEFIDAGIMIDNNTQVICIPEIADEEDDYLVSVNVDITNNTEGYRVTGYDMDESRKKAKLLVIRAKMDASRVRETSLTSSKASMITNVKHQYDDNMGDYKTIFTILNDGKEVVLEPMQYTSENNHILNLKTGDLISYVTNTNGLLENALHFHSFRGNLSPFTSDSTEEGFTEVLGTVTSFVPDELDVRKNVLVSKMEVSVNGNVESFLVPQRNKPPVYIYSTSSEDSIITGSLNDINPGSDMVYVLKRTSDSLIRAIVIVR